MRIHRRKLFRTRLSREWPPGVGPQIGLVGAHEIGQCGSTARIWHPSIKPSPHGLRIDAELRRDVVLTTTSTVAASQSSPPSPAPAIGGSTATRRHVWRGSASTGPSRTLLKYERVAAIVRTRIVDGTLQPGEAAPSAAALARATGISVLTCRRALRTLVEEGTLTPGPSRNARPRVPAFASTLARPRSESPSRRSAMPRPAACGSLGASGRRPIRFSAPAVNCSSCMTPTEPRLSDRVQPKPRPTKQRSRCLIPTPRRFPV